MLDKERLIGKYRGIFDCETGEEHDIVELYIDELNKLKGTSTCSSGYVYTLQCLYIDENVIVFSYYLNRENTTEIIENIDTNISVGHCIFKLTMNGNLEGVFINPYPYEHIDKNCGNYKLIKI